MLSLRSTITLLLLVWSPLIVPDPRSNASFYVDTFGVVNPDKHEIIRRAQRIFDQLKLVASNTTVSSRLVIIDAVAKPWALALADGNIVLSRGALDIIYSSNNVEQGDNWLAFVLGHELAHLGSRDLWQQQVFASLTAISGSDVRDLTQLQSDMSISTFDLQAWRERELKADEVGYVLAALAGFNVDEIFGKDTSHDFLSVWESQTGATGGDTHYGAKVRTQLLKLRLEEASHRVDLFHLGVILARFGRFDDALVILSDFQKFFSSREALINLGYVHLQMARRVMPAELAYRYWLPALYESDSGLRIPTRSFVTALPPEAEKHLTESVRLLSLALDMKPGDLTASINLSVAYLYLGRSFRARAVLEDALIERPDNASLRMLRALVLVNQEPDIDMWPRAVEQMKSLDIRNPSVVYNLARLHQERGRIGKANDYWRRLFDKLDTLPGPYRREVCTALEVNCAATGAFGVISHHPALSGHLKRMPFQPGQDVLQSQSERGGDIQSHHWIVGEISGQTVKFEGTTAYAIDGTIEVIKHRLDERNLSSDDLASLLGTAFDDSSNQGDSVYLHNSERGILELWQVQ